MREKMYLLPVLPLDTILSRQVAASPDEIRHTHPPLLLIQTSKTKTKREFKIKAWNGKTSVLCRSVTRILSFRNCRKLLSDLEGPGWCHTPRVKAREASSMHSFIHSLLPWLLFGHGLALA